MSPKYDLLKGRLVPLFFHFLITSVAGMLMVSVYILFDTIFIGQGLGSEGLAALSILLPVFCLLYGTGMLFGMGGGALMSIYMGQGNVQKAREVFTHVWLLMWVVGGLMSGIGLVFLDPICRFLGAQGQTFVYVKEYLIYIIGFGFTFVMINGTTIFIRNDHAPRWAMAATVTTGFINIILDYIFIFPLQMGMAGAAIATIISSSAALLVCLLYIVFKSKNLKLTRSKFQIGLITKSMSLGFPSYVVEVSSGVVIFAFNSVILRTIGDIGVSAYSILANIMLIVVAVFTGIAQGIQPILSLNYGADQYRRVKNTRKMALVTALAIGIVIFGIGYLFPEPLIALFSSDQGQLRVITKQAMMYFFPAFIIMGVNIVLGSYKQSIDHAAHSAFITFGRGIVFVLIGLWVLPIYFGEAGIWLTIPFAELATLILGLILLPISHNKAYKNHGKI